MNSNNLEKDMNNPGQLDFDNKIERMGDYYTEDKFVLKLKKTGGKLAKKALYASLVLFYALKSPELPQKSRLVILGALGYFILPLDLIPDFIPVIGLTDDAAILVAAFGKLYKAINEDTKEKARKKMRNWFGIND